MPDGADQEARDALFLSQLGKDLKGPFPSRWTCPQVQPWLYGYDAYEEVEDAVKKNPFPLLGFARQNGDLQPNWFSSLTTWLSFLPPFCFWRMQR